MWEHLFIKYKCNRIRHDATDLYDFRSRATHQLANSSITNIRGCFLALVLAQLKERSRIRLVLIDQLIDWLIEWLEFQIETRKVCEIVSLASIEPNENKQTAIQYFWPQIKCVDLEIGAASA